MGYNFISHQIRHRYAYVGHVLDHGWPSFFCFYSEINLTNDSLNDLFNDLTPSIPRGVQRSHSSIRHPWYLWALRRPPEGDFSVEMQCLVNCNGT